MPSRPQNSPPGTLDLSVVTTTQLSAADKQAIVALCTRAFDEDFSSLFDFVQTGDHVLAHLDGRLVGHAVWGTRWLQIDGGPLLRAAYVDAGYVGLLFGGGADGTTSAQTDGGYFFARAFNYYSQGLIPLP